MEHRPILGDEPEMALADPCHYVRQADLALLYGSRAEAVTLIAQAYLAYDLALAEDAAITGLRRVWPGKSS
jgi:hypothetical protein